MNNDTRHRNGILLEDKSLLWTDQTDRDAMPAGAYEVWRLITDGFMAPPSHVVTVKCKECYKCIAAKYGYVCPECGSAITEEYIKPDMQPYLLYSVLNLYRCECGSVLFMCSRGIRGIRTSYLKEQDDTI